MVACMPWPLQFLPPMEALDEPWPDIYAAMRREDLPADLETSLKKVRNKIAMNYGFRLVRGTEYAVATAGWLEMQLAQRMRKSIEFLQEINARRAARGRARRRRAAA